MPGLTCAESRNDVVRRSVPRIRKIIISNGADRARLKMSSPGRLVGQTFSSIIPGPAAERRSPWDSSSTDRDLSSAVVKTRQGCVRDEIFTA